MYSAQAVERPTFLYMPCCPRELYEAVLDANWSKDALGKLVVWGTSFQSMGATAGFFAALAGASAGGGRPQVQDPTAAGSTSSRQSLARVESVTSRGAVLELFGPDFAAHGIGTSLHLFPRHKLLSSRIFSDLE